MHSLKMLLKDKQIVNATFHPICLDTCNENKIIIFPDATEKISQSEVLGIWYNSKYYDKTRVVNIAQTSEDYLYIAYDYKLDAIVLISNNILIRGCDIRNYIMQNPNNVSVTYMYSH